MLVSAHARDRFIERFPDEAARVRDVNATIHYDVREALRMGRISKNRPRWLAGPDGSRRQAKGTKSRTRVVWTLGETRGYLILPEAIGGGQRAWRVLTVLSPTKGVGERIGVAVRRTAASMYRRGH